MPPSKKLVGRIKVLDGMPFIPAADEESSIETFLGETFIFRATIPTQPKERTTWLHTAIENLSKSEADSAIGFTAVLKADLEWALTVQLLDVLINHSKDKKAIPIPFSMAQRIYEGLSSVDNLSAIKAKKDAIKAKKDTSKT